MMPPRIELSDSLTREDLDRARRHQSNREFARIHHEVSLLQLTHTPIAKPASTATHVRTADSAPADKEAAGEAGGTDTDCLLGGESDESGICC
jgi:hypothetical protein